MSIDDSENVSCYATSKREKCVILRYNNKESGGEWYEKKGYSRPGLFGSINHYDENGKKVSESRPGFFGSMKHYDNKGKKQQRRAKKKVKVIQTSGEVYQDDSFSFIAGYTSGDAPYGVT